METYVQVSFWFGILGLLINIISMAVSDFPIQKSESLGQKTAIVLVSAGFVGWAGFLLFSGTI
jgi:hypothetical protein